MDPEKNTRSLPSIVCTIIALLLIMYAVIDFSVTQPKIRSNVKHVAVQFDSMKMYLDTKLPQMDSALMMHTQQIQEQTEYLKGINSVSSILIHK